MAKIPLEGFRISVTKALRDGLKVAAEEVFDRMRENAGLTDHSLDELEKLGHPYAVRNFQSLHIPTYQVHRQSNRLYDNIEMKQVNQFTYDVGVNMENVPYLAAVLFGTRVMVARPFITESYNEVKNELRRIINKAIKIGLEG